MNIKKGKFISTVPGKPRLSGESSPLRLLKYGSQLAIFGVLYGISWLYRGIVQLRLRLYRNGLLKRTVLPCPVISIGNITTGGTGKTPMVIAVARILQKHGKRVAVLSRGYNRKDATKDSILIPADGKNIAVETVGDEPLLIAKKLRSVRSAGIENATADIAATSPVGSVIVGRKRSLSGQLAIERLQSDIIVLDDGFQHVQLSRNCDIVLVDATNPFGGGCLLPAGFLREPLANLRRAHAIVITRSNEAENIEPLRRQLQRLTPEAPVFTARHVFDGVHEAITGECIEIEHLRTCRLLAVSGLANPASFHRLLHGLDIPIIQTLDFPDHHWFSETDFERIRHTLANQHLDAVVTTEKDEVRIDILAEHVPIYAVAIALHVQPDTEFTEFLLSQSALH
jgi:tetraacyldisaccharide 4'-kinase